MPGPGVGAKGCLGLCLPGEGYLPIPFDQAERGYEPGPPEALEVIHSWQEVAVELQHLVQPAKVVAEPEAS